jgi:dolichol-phosphate mannosyltransferase
MPAYNEEGAIEKLLKRIKTGMESRGFEYAVVVYNDGSTDGTTEILKQHEAAIPLKVIGQDKNQGLGVAMRLLLEEAIESSTDEDDILVTLDSDNTHNPELVYTMVNKIREGFDVAIASRYLRDSRIVGVTRFRQFLSSGASWMMRIMFPIKGVKDFTCGYRAYRVAILQKAFEKYGDRLIEETGFACMAELLIKLRSLDVLAVEVPLVLRYDQKSGTSKMNVLQTVKRTLSMISRLRTRQ